jgi:DNA-binding beta-propeller fold protein YncE
MRARRLPCPAVRRVRTRPKFSPPPRVDSIAGGGWSTPDGVAVLPDGSSALVANHGSHRISIVVVNSGQARVLAGSYAGYQDGKGENATFNGPSGLALTPDGSTVLIADSNNHAIRSITVSTGQVSTLAGSGSSGDQDGANARFNLPRDVAVSPDGSRALVADTNNHKIRSIDLATGSVTTLAGGPRGIRVVSTSSGCGSDRVTSQSECERLAGEISGKSWGGTNYASTRPRECYYSGSSVYYNTHHRSYSQCSSSYPCVCFEGPDSPGYQDGLGTTAKFQYPGGVAFTADGSRAVVADTYNHKLRLIELATGNVTTIAGAYYAGSSDGYGTEAQFYYPWDLVLLQHSDTFLVTDYNNHRIRILNSRNGLVVTFAGSYSGSQAGSYGSYGSYMYGGFQDGVLSSVLFQNPRGIATIPGSGKALVADGGNDRIRVLASGWCTQCPGGTYLGLEGGVSCSSCPARSYSVPGSSSRTACTCNIGFIIQEGGECAGPCANNGFPDYQCTDCGTGTYSAQPRVESIRTGVGELSEPDGIVVMPDGVSALVATAGSHTISAVDIKSGQTQVLAGGAGYQDGTGTYATFNGPSGLALTPDGSTVLIADSNNHAIRSITVSTRQVSTLAGSGSSGDQDGANARFNLPRDVAVSPDGSRALVADTNNHKIRSIDLATGSVTTLAGGGVRFGTSPNGGCGSNWMTSESECQEAASTLSKYWAGSSTWSNYPRGCVILYDPYVYFNAYSNSETLCSSSYQCICSTAAYQDGIGAAAKFKYPQGVAFTADGSRAVVADTYNHKLRLIELATGSVTTIAGAYTGSSGAQDGYGTIARFSSPWRVVTAGLDTFLVTDRDNHRIRVMSASIGLVETFAGLSYQDGLPSSARFQTPPPGGGGMSEGYKDGLPSNARFRSPRGIAVIPGSGKVLVADAGNNRIRVLTSGTCLCGAGLYRATQGAYAYTCQGCPRGSWAEAGSTGSSSCYCLTGFYGAAGQCTPCDLGFFKSINGSTDCESCPPNSVSRTGSTSARDCLCNAGFFGDNGQPCWSCDTGKFSDSLGSTTCTACPRSKYSSYLAATTCLACAAGKMAAKTGSTSASMCSLTLSDLEGGGGGGEQLAAKDAEIAALKVQLSGQTAGGVGAGGGGAGGAGAGGGTSEQLAAKDAEIAALKAQLSGRAEGGAGAGGGAARSVHIDIILPALILAAAVFGILAGCVVCPRQIASVLRAAASAMRAGERDSAGDMQMRSIESGTASLLHRAEATVDVPAEMAIHEVSRVSVGVNVIPEGDAVGGRGGESTEAGPPDVTPGANASTADDAKPAMGGGAAAEKESGAAAKLEKVKKKVDSDSDDDANPAAKGGGAAAKRSELVGLDTTKPQNASTSAAKVDQQPQAQECRRQASAHLRADAIAWQGLEPFMESLGLSKYAQVLKEQEFANREALVLLTDEDLKEMQVTIGARRRLLTAIKSLQNPAASS